MNASRDHETCSRTAVVTGASGGIGRDVAKRLALDGMNVVVSGRNVEGLDETAELVRGTGREAFIVRADVTVEGDVQTLAASAISRFGTVDVLVNNSGVPGPSGPLWTLDVNDWRHTFGVNVEGTFLCCKAFIPVMIEQGHGSIVNIGSLTGKRPLISRTPYAASKMAVLGLTRSLALDVGQYGIRVNCVSPGPVMGERLETVLRNLSIARGSTYESVASELAADSALHRFIIGSEVASAVAYLASDDSAGISGLDLDVNAGLHMS